MIERYQSKETVGTILFRENLESQFFKKSWDDIGFIHSFK